MIRTFGSQISFPLVFGVRAHGDTAFVGFLRSRSWCTNALLFSISFFALSNPNARSVLHAKAGVAARGGVSIERFAAASPSRREGWRPMQLR